MLGSYFSYLHLKHFKLTLSTKKNQQQPTKIFISFLILFFQNSHIYIYIALFYIYI